MFGVKIEETERGYKVKGKQEYKPYSAKVEGDWSQAAFFCVANALGCDIELDNLNYDSVQGDRIINDIIQKWENSSEKYFEINASDIPDLVPILAVLGTFGTKPSVITGAERLKIKESDRLQAISDMINRLGGNIETRDDGLYIKPVEYLKGGEINSFGDHRIAMCAAIAAVKSKEDVIINGADAVKKSYPEFFSDYIRTGGKVNGIIME